MTIRKRLIDNYFNVTAYPNLRGKFANQYIASIHPD